MGDTRGAGLVEYILVLGLIALVAFAGFKHFGQQIKLKAEQQAKCIQTLDCSGNAQAGVDDTPLEIDASVPQSVAEAAKFSPTVRAAIERMNKDGVKIVIGTPGGGSFFSSGSNTITLDPNGGTDPGTFVHEINHSNYFHDGKHADIQNMTRDEYVTSAINEEIEGDVVAAQATYELIQAGQNPSKPPFFDAYEKGVADELARNPGATQAELQAAGREAQRQRERQAFYNGELVTSTTGQTYPDYYGGAWDGVHPKP